MVSLRLLVAAGACVALVLATPLTFELEAHGEECFSVVTEDPNLNIGLYFAVQLGGDFDVDYKVLLPLLEVLFDEHKQRQGLWSFNAKVPGEYLFCFSNAQLTKENKMVDFEVHENRKPSLRLPLNAERLEAMEGMRATIDLIDSKLGELLRGLQYYKTRTNRNQATVKSTELRIFWFSLFEVVLMCGMAGFQVTVVQLFFKGARRQLV